MVRETRHLKFSNISEDVTEERFKGFLNENCGRVQKVELVRSTGKTVVQSAIVSFVDIRTASKAVDSRLSLEGLVLRAEYYEPGLNSSAVIEIHDSGKIPAPGYSSRYAGNGNAPSTSTFRENERTSPRVPRSSSRHSGRQRRRSRSGSGSSHASESSSRSPSGRRSLNRPPLSAGTERCGRGKFEGKPLPVLIVRNLPARSVDHSIKDGLYHKYKKCGTVVSVKVCGDKDDRYGVVQFRRFADVEKILDNQSRNGEDMFLGSKIAVELATPSIDLSVDDNERKPFMKMRNGLDFDSLSPLSSRTLYIGNLENRNLTKDLLRNMFEPFGEILDIDIKNLNTPCPFAFIQFADIVSVVKAIHKMDAEYMGPNKLKCGFGKSLATHVVWFDDLPECLTQSHLDRKMNYYGMVTDSVLDRFMQQALVYFDSIEVASAAVKDMKERKICNKRVQVDYASRELQDLFLDRMDRMRHHLSTTGGYGPPPPKDDFYLSPPAPPPPAYEPPLIDPFIDRYERMDRYNRLKRYSREQSRDNSARCDYRDYPENFPRDGRDSFREPVRSSRPNSERGTYTPEPDERRPPSSSRQSGRRVRSRSAERVSSPRERNPSRSSRSRNSREQERGSSRAAKGPEPKPKSPTPVSGAKPRETPVAKTNGRRASPDAYARHRPEEFYGPAPPPPKSPPPAAPAVEAPPAVVPPAPGPAATTDPPNKAGRDSRKSSHAALVPKKKLSKTAKTASSSSSDTDSSTSTSDDDSSTTSVDSARGPATPPRKVLSPRPGRSGTPSSPTIPPPPPPGVSNEAGATTTAAVETQNTEPPRPVEPPSTGQEAEDRSIPELLRKQQELLKLLETLPDDGEDGEAGTSGGKEKRPPRLSDIFDLKWQRNRREAVRLSTGVVQAIASPAVQLPLKLESIPPPPPDKPQPSVVQPAAHEEALHVLSPKSDAGPDAPLPSPPFSSPLAGLPKTATEETVDLPAPSLAESAVVLPPKPVPPPDPSDNAMLPRFSGFWKLPPTASDAAKASVTPPTEPVTPGPPPEVSTSPTRDDSTPTEFKKRKRPQIKMRGEVGSPASGTESSAVADPNPASACGNSLSGQVRRPTDENSDEGKGLPDIPKSAAPAPSGKADKFVFPPHTAKIIPLDAQESSMVKDPRKPVGSTSCSTDFSIPQFGLRFRTERKRCPTAKLHDVAEMKKVQTEVMNERRYLMSKLSRRKDGGDEGDSDPLEFSPIERLTLVISDSAGQQSEVSPGSVFANSPPKGTQSSLEERIKALDEKFNVLEKAVQAAKSNELTSSKHAFSSGIAAATSVHATVNSSPATTTHSTIDYAKFTIRRKPNFGLPGSASSISLLTSSVVSPGSVATTPDLDRTPGGGHISVFTPQTPVETSLPFSSSTLSKNALRSTIFDQDSERLANLDSKFTPGVYRPSLSSVSTDAADPVGDVRPAALAVPETPAEAPPPAEPAPSPAEVIGIQSSGFQPKRPSAPPKPAAALPVGAGLVNRHRQSLSIVTSGCTPSDPPPPTAQTSPFPLSPPPVHGILKKPKYNTSISVPNTPADPKHFVPDLPVSAPAIPSDPRTLRTDPRSQVSPGSAPSTAALPSAVSTQSSTSSQLLLSTSRQGSEPNTGNAVKQSTGFKAQVGALPECKAQVTEKSTGSKMVKSPRHSASEGIVKNKESRRETDSFVSCGSKEEKSRKRDEDEKSTRRTEKEVRKKEKSSSDSGSPSKKEKEHKRLKLERKLEKSGKEELKREKFKTSSTMQGRKAPLTKKRSRKSDNEGESEPDSDGEQSKTAHEKEWAEVLAALNDEPAGLSMYDRVKRRSSHLKPEQTSDSGKKGDKFSKLKERRTGKRKRILSESTSEGELSDHSAGHSGKERDAADLLKKVGKKAKIRLEDVYTSEEDESPPPPQKEKPLQQAIAPKPAKVVERQGGPVISDDEKRPPPGKPYLTKKKPSTQVNPPAQPVAAPGPTIAKPVDKVVEKPAKPEKVEREKLEKTEKEKLKEKSKKRSSDPKKREDSPASDDSGHEKKKPRLLVKRREKENKKASKPDEKPLKRRSKEEAAPAAKTAREEDSKTAPKLTTEQEVKTIDNETVSADIIQALHRSASDTGGLQEVENCPIEVAVAEVIVSDLGAIQTVDGEEIDFVVTEEASEDEAPVPPEPEPDRKPLISPDVVKTEEPSSEQNEEPPKEEAAEPVAVTEELVHRTAEPMVSPVKSEKAATPPPCHPSLDSDTSAAPEPQSEPEPEKLQSPKIEASIEIENPQPISLPPAPVIETSLPQQPPKIEVSLPSPVVSAAALISMTLPIPTTSAEPPTSPTGVLPISAPPLSVPICMATPRNTLEHLFLPTVPSAPPPTSVADMVTEKMKDVHMDKVIDDVVHGVVDSGHSDPKKRPPLGGRRNSAAGSFDKNHVQSVVSQVASGVTSSEPSPRLVESLNAGYQSVIVNSSQSSRPASVSGAEALGHPLTQASSMDSVGPPTLHQSSAFSVVPPAPGTPTPTGPSRPESVSSASVVTPTTVAAALHSMDILRQLGGSFSSLFSPLASAYDLAGIAQKSVGGLDPAAFSANQSAYAAAAAQSLLRLGGVTAAVTSTTPAIDPRAFLELQKQRWTPAAGYPGLTLPATRADHPDVGGIQAPPRAATAAPAGAPSSAGQDPTSGPSTFKALVQKYPIMWQGNLALKNDTSLVQMHFVAGNRVLPSQSLPAAPAKQPKDPEQSPAMLRIAQRMRLEPEQLDGVAKRMELPEEHSILLALPCGRDQVDIFKQSRQLQQAFIAYLQQKQAAGIVNVCGPGSQVPQYVVHIFPPCDFARRSLTSVADDFYRSVKERDTPYLFVVVATV